MQIPYFILLCLFFFHPLSAEIADPGLLPVSHKGRYIPLDVYANLWFFDLYHAKKMDTGSEKFVGNDPLTIFLSVYLNGIEPYKDVPLFYHQEKKRFSYSQLSNQEKEDIQKKLNPSLKLFPKESRPYEWIDLKEYLKNPTKSLFSEQDLIEALNEWKLNPSRENGGKFATLYFKDYLPLTTQIYSLSKHTTIAFPSVYTLRLERLYQTYPWVLQTILLYFIGFTLLCLAQYKNSSKMTKMGLLIFITAFIIHFFILILRSYILGRPPVSNMAETIFYVPWIASLLSIFLYLYFKSRWILISASLLTGTLLSLLEMTFGSRDLENVQPVLNSQFWLSIHVLMIVGSYGALITGGFLGHLYLLQKKPGFSAKVILQTLYIGVALLIPGTLLGGVWAAQSWGRFWDWDPKESWAFITALTYLVIIHLNRFGKIGDFGLAIGSIIGMLAVSFTWYGVNYILGTGLHSYGFGTGGEWIYYSFLIFEIIFIFSVLTLQKNSFRKGLFLQNTRSKD